MLQDIRQSTKGTTAKIVVGLIVVSFSIFGIESILVGGGGSGVAKVNGEEIMPQELEQAVNSQKRQLISMMGDSIDPAMLDDQFLRSRALEALVNRRLLTQAAAEMDLTVSDQEIGRVVGGMEQFRMEGKFSPELYTSVLASAGFTPSYFKLSLRDDIAINQLRSGLAGSEFSTAAELALNAGISDEQRDLSYLTVPVADFLEGRTATEAEVQAYYDTHQDEFRTQESVELNYIELTADQFRQPVDEEAVVEAYRQEIGNAQYQTENRISHILFAADPDTSAESQQQRLAAASNKLAEGADFGAVAAEFSDDAGSSGKGGDLGFSRGDAFSPEIETAIKTLDVGAVSAPIKTAAGIQLIKLTEQREGKAPALEEIRPRLEDQLQLVQARAELLRQVERLKDLVFNAEDLKAPAKELGLTVKQSELVTRSQAEGLFAQPTLLTAAFSEDVLEAGHNSDVVELGGDRFVVLRVHQHRRPQVKALALVSEQIASTITANKARAAVREVAEQIVRKLQTGNTMELLSGEFGYLPKVELAVDRRNATLPREVIQRAFSMPVPAPNSPVIDFVMTPAGDALVISLVRATPGDYQKLEKRAQLLVQQQVGSETVNLLDTEFQQGLRESAEITVF